MTESDFDVVSDDDSYGSFTIVSDEDEEVKSLASEPASDFVEIKSLGVSDSADVKGESDEVKSLQGESSEIISVNDLEEVKSLEGEQEQVDVVNDYDKVKSLSEEVKSLQVDLDEVKSLQNEPPEVISHVEGEPEEVNTVDEHEYQKTGGVFISGLPLEFTDEQVEEILDDFEVVSDYEVVNVGYEKVCFSTYQEPHVEQVCARMNGLQIGDRVLVARPGTYMDSYYYFHQGYGNAEYEGDEQVEQEQYGEGGEQVEQGQDELDNKGEEDLDKEGDSQEEDAEYEDESSESESEESTDGGEWQTEEQDDGYKEWFEGEGSEVDSEEDEEDETGLDRKDIELVMNQVAASRVRAVMEISEEQNRETCAVNEFDTQGGDVVEAEVSGAVGDDIQVDNPEVEVSESVKEAGLHPKDIEVVMACGVSRACAAKALRVREITEGQDMERDVVNEVDTHGDDIIQVDKPEVEVSEAVKDAIHVDKVADEVCTGETGLDPKDIEVVMTYGGVSRACAVNALRLHGDAIDAVVEIRKNRKGEISINKDEISTNNVKVEGEGDEWVLVSKDTYEEVYDPWHCIPMFSRLKFDCLYPWRRILSFSGFKKTHEF